MTWTLEGDASTEWTAATVTSPYVKFGYVVADYFEDEEWVVTADDDETWTLA